MASVTADIVGETILASRTIAPEMGVELSSREDCPSPAMEPALASAMDDEGSLLAISPWQSWAYRIEELQEQYQRGIPYPSIVLDDFLHEEVAARLAAEFPTSDSAAWTHYRHYNENKLGNTDLSAFPPNIRLVVEVLQSDEFVSWLSRLTGIPGLRSDPGLEGGGLHQTERGGFLNVHADFATHRHRPNWRRRCNVLLYLNPVWEEEWLGLLELWDPQMTACRQKILPILNRMVVFSTTDEALHGYPDSIQCPPEVSRRSLALYYYTEEDAPATQRSTLYKARPSDTMWQRAMVRLDGWLVAAYSSLKRRLGLSDRLASALLRRLPGGKRPKSR